MSKLGLALSGGGRARARVHDAFLDELVRVGICVLRIRSPAAP